MSIPAERLTSDEAQARGPLRFISAASLFDGHDAAINIIRRILQAHGAEVIHLGHNRSVADIVRAAIQEDADGIAVSSYQGGHNEYFRYMVDMLRESNASHIRVVVGGGGTIAPYEIDELEAYGIEKIYSPDDGLRLGLDGMIEDVLRRIRARPKVAVSSLPAAASEDQQIARAISLLLLPAPDSGTGTAAETATAETQARRILTGLQKGQIDRALFTANCNFYFDQTSLDDHTRSLGPLGAVQTVAQTSSSLRGGMTFRAFDVAFAKGPKLRLTTYTTRDGRLEQFLISPID